MAKEYWEKTAQDKVTINNTLKHKKQRTGTQNKERRIIIKTIKRIARTEKKRSIQIANKKEQKGKKNFLTTTNHPTQT